jgi:hypothetical protein
LKIISHAATTIAILALAATPAFAHGRSGHAPGKDDNPGSAHRLAAPGQYCKAASKKHVEGEKGTPFSVCVNAQAKLRKGATDSPRAACKAASKKHVKGEKGTPFSVCVKAGKKLLEDDQAADDDETAGDDETASEG